MEEEGTEAFADVVADMGIIYGMHFICGFFHYALYEMPRVRKQLVGFFEINKSARNYVW